MLSTMALFWLMRGSAQKNIVSKNIANGLIQCAVASPEGFGKHSPGTHVGLVYLAAGRVKARIQLFRCCVIAEALWVVPPSLSFPHVLFRGHVL